MKNYLGLAALVAFFATLSFTNAEAARSVFNTGSDIGMGNYRDGVTDIRPGANLPDTRLGWSDRYDRRAYYYGTRYDMRADRDVIRADNRPAYVADADNGDVIVYDNDFDRFYVYNRLNDRYTPHEQVVYRHISDRHFNEGDWVLLDTNNDGYVDTRARILYPDSVSADMRERAERWNGPYPYFYIP
jgi:hypothetical protein